MYKETVNLPDRILSFATYITGGGIGVLWLIFCALTSRRISKFLMFNIYQSAFLALFLFLAKVLLVCIYNILILIPFIKILVNIIYKTLFIPIFYTFSPVDILIYTVFVYLSVCSILGVIGRLPFISKIILYQIERF